MSPRSRGPKPPVPHVDVPLSAKVLRDGRLIIEIGVGTLAFAAIRSAYAWGKANPDHDAQHDADPSERYEVTSADGFAREVVDAMLAEEEDGSSMLTDMLDKAAQKAIEDGSEHFREKGSDDE